MSFLMLTLAQGGGSGHVSGLRQGHAQKHAQEARQVGIKTRVKEMLGFPVLVPLYLQNRILIGDFRALNDKFSSVVNLDAAKS